MDDDGLQGDLADQSGLAPTVSDRVTFEGLLAHVSDMVTVVDAHGICTFANPAVLRMSGYDRTEVVGLAANESMHPDDRNRVITEATNQLLGLSEPGPIRFRQTCKDGTYRHVEAQTSRLPEGHPMGAVVITTRDVNERVEAEQAHRESQAIVRMVAEGKDSKSVLTALALLVEGRVPECTVSISLVEEDGATLRWAAGPSLSEDFVARIDGLTVGPTTGSCATATWMRSSVIVSDIQTDPRWVDARDIATEAGFKACWSTPILSTGSELVLGTLALYWTDNARPNAETLAHVAEAAGLATVALERFRIEGELAFRATHDMLTGLPNRTLLHDRIEQALARRRRGDLGEVAVLFIDLDHFKQVNDEFGHAFGDELLAVAGERLRASARLVDTVARFGGDEFIILAHTDDVDVFASRINEAMTAPFPIGDGLRVSCSIGVAIATDTDTPPSMIRRADLMLYRAKKRGRNCYVVDRDQPPVADAVKTTAAESTDAERNGMIRSDSGGD